METFGILIFLVAVIGGVVLLMLGVTALLSRFNKNADPPTWCNPNSLDQNVLGFHCPDLSLAYTATDNSVRMRCIDAEGISYEFEGDASDINLSALNEEKTTEYVQDYVSDNTGFKHSIGSPRSYQRGTGIFTLGIQWKASPSLTLSKTIRINNEDRIKLDKFRERVDKLTMDHFLKAEILKSEFKAKEYADNAAAEQKAKADALQNVRNQCSKLLRDWSIDPEGAFMTYRYRDDDGGYICTMLAADKEGRGGAVLNDGKDTWSGSWNNAQVSEVGETLEVQIDDPEYRKQNLKELRFVIKYMDREQRVEWIDRIRILSVHA